VIAPESRRDAGGTRTHCGTRLAQVLSRDRDGTDAVRSDAQGRRHPPSARRRSPDLPGLRTEPEREAARLGKSRSSRPCAGCLSWARADRPGGGRHRDTPRSDPPGSTPRHAPDLREPRRYPGPLTQSASTGAGGAAAQRHAPRRSPAPVSAHCIASTGVRTSAPGGCCAGEACGHGNRVMGARERIWGAPPWGRVPGTAGCAGARSGAARVALEMWVPCRFALLTIWTRWLATGHAYKRGLR